MGKSGKYIKKPNIEDDEVYHVEVITEARVVPVSNPSSEDDVREGISEVFRKKKKKKKKDKSSARWEYYVKWAGYESDANSWEPEENVADCQRLLSSFWEHIGQDNNDYHVGYVVKADEQWIKKEKNFFAKEYKSVQDQLRRQREHEEREPKAKQIKVPRSSTSALRKGKKKAVDVELISSESEDDKPLSPVVPLKRKSIQISSDEDEPIFGSAPPSKTQKMSSFSRKVTFLNPIQDTSEDGPSKIGAPTELFTPSPEEISVPKPLPKVQPIPLPPPAKKPQTSVRSSRRPYNQHVSIAAGTTDMSVSKSAISTKQRLAQQALKPVLPRNPTLHVPLFNDSDKMGLPSTTSTRQALTSLSIKKTATTVQSPHIPSAMPESVAVSQSNSTVIPENVYSASSGMSAQVDSFLKIIVPPELAAPIIASPEVDHGPMPPKPVLLRKLPPPTRIPKKWKWSGPLVLENADRGDETINVTIQDCTEPIAMGLRFNIVLTEVKKLIAPSFHDFRDVTTLLRACHPVSQLGRIVSEEDKDAASLSILSLFMSKLKQVILIPAILDEEIVGFFLLFSPDSDLCRKFNVPQDLRQPRSLVLSLIPLELSAKQRALDWRRPISAILPRNIDIEQTIEDVARWERSIRSKVSYHHALLVLKFPKALHDFMAVEHKRPFCVWWDGGDVSNFKSRPGIETMYLLSIMEQCRAGNVGLKSAARVVFIHVGALKTIHKMPQFVDRRANHPLVQFYTYGTHESVAPSIWGVREIWPCGGVVTFMPQAALDDFFSFLHRVRQIYVHPLWTSYVIPSVIGMTARVVCGNEDPLAVFDRGDFLLNELLSTIADGELAMITAPRDEQHSTSTNELGEQWITRNILLQPDNEREILQYAVSSFNVRYSNVQPSEWTRCIAEELSTDLSYMQRQPAFMRNYRRYVVLQGNRQEISLSDSFEWLTTTSFEFRDEFFPKQVNAFA
ncbi:hypothetical protein AX15_001186 [Amanita polypyramis BW_CC]|nr:hypothetical protein AX15_001186 [Amanita polypyramis BW_CC]